MPKRSFGPQIWGQNGPLDLNFWEKVDNFFFFFHQFILNLSFGPRFWRNLRKKPKISNFFRKIWKNFLHWKFFWWNFRPFNTANEGTLRFASLTHVWSEQDPSRNKKNGLIRPKIIKMALNAPNCTSFALTNRLIGTEL